MIHNPLPDLLANRHFLTALVGLVLAQVLKIPFEYLRTRSLSRALLFSTGGMPSSHSSTSVALMVSIGFYEGFGTPIFAIAATLAMVVMHDAAGVRRAAGQHAAAINLLFSKLESQGITLDKRLKELLGHQPIEVMAGALLGVLVALGAYFLFPV